jgi:sugar lactone lactonase YvrE
VISVFLPRPSGGGGPALLLFFLTAALAGCGGEPGPGPGGGVARVVGSLGTGPGQLFYPRSACVNGRGQLCVVDKSGRLQWFDPEGRFLFAVELPACQKGFPTGINFARSGELLVADSHYQRILVYGPTAGGERPPQVVRSWGSEGAGPSQFTMVRDVVEDSLGCLYSGDYDGPEDRIQKFSPEGRFILSFGKRGSGPGEFQRPQGLAVERREDGRESILVADSCNHRIQRFSLEGRFEGSFGRLGSGPGELKYPYGVAAAPPGSPAAPGIYVAEWGNNRVQRFHHDGRPAGLWGRAGRGPGELSTPWDVAIGPDGKLVVVDYGNHRLQVLLPDALGG